eukprot:Nitzschia sp. Nitz4//scaffold230_size58257//26246//27726//NITZ4_006481-RA/size58257-augustus-gene-0.3-mRNA-1//1//CDS//3329543250//7166//frame0
MSILLLPMVEGGQCSMVGLPPVNRELYKESHPITYKICSLGHKGDNLDRYLMGRQFMVIFINFTISQCGAPLDVETDVLGLPGWPVVTNEAPRTTPQAIFFWGRCVFSLGVLTFALAVTLKALFDGNTTMWDGVPNTVAVILFFVLMSVVGLLEGMQIAFFMVSKLPKSERGEHPMAMRTCELLFRGEGKNLPGFMVGRQMTVTLCFFVIARVTSLDIEPGMGDNIFGVSDPIQKFFNFGFLGAIITTILGSIAWQLVASAFPLEFLANPFVYVFLNLALALEATGFCAASWFFGIVHKSVAGFQLDEVYIGTPEERAAMDKADLCSEKGDSVAEAHLGTNVLNFAPGANRFPEVWQELAPIESFTVRRQRILSNIKDFRDQIKASVTDDEREAFEAGLKAEIDALKKINALQAAETSGDVDVEALASEDLDV